MQRPEYKKVFAISQSALKAFKTKTLQEFVELYINKEEEDDDVDAKFAFGSLVDTIAFNPELLDERFYIPSYEVALPSEKVQQIIDKVYKEAASKVEMINTLNEKGNLPEPIYLPNIADIWEWQDLVIKHAKAVGFGGSTWSTNRIMDKIGDEGNPYFRLLGESNGRQVITSADNMDAVEVVDKLKTNKLTYPYFTQQENETLLFQQEIFIDHVFKDGLIVPLKGAIDIIRIKHHSESVEIPDLKTTHTSEQFAKIARDFGYIVQVSFYTNLVREWLKTYEDGKYAHYTIEIPSNIVIDRKNKIPFIYEYFAEDLDIIEFGSKERGIEGWRSTLEQIGWHIATKQWDIPRELFETGKIKLRIFR
jgi:hypothetical protein